MFTLENDETIVVRGSRRAMATVGLCAAAALSALPGCRVEPRYVQPQVPTPPAYVESSSVIAPGVLWRPAEPQEIADRGRWWQMFGDAELNALEERVDSANQQIAVAVSNYAAARADVRAVRSLSIFRS